MMLIVPLQAVPSQTVQVPLGGQNVALSIYQKRAGLYIDVAANGVPIVYGQICENLNLIVRSSYHGFVGDFVWIDNEAPSPSTGADPVYTGIGTRFSLAYLDPADLPAGLGTGVS